MLEPPALTGKLLTEPTISEEAKLCGGDRARTNFSEFYSIWFERG